MGGFAGRKTGSGRSVGPQRLSVQHRWWRCAQHFRISGCAVPIGWTTDGHSLFIYLPGELPANVYRLDLATGQKQLWKALVPADTAGITDIGPILIAADGKAYVYEYGRTLSDLFLVEGVK